MGDAQTWALIHAERGAMADTLETLAPEQWASPSLCAGWSVHDAAAHILTGAEQTPRNFFTRLAANGFRFDKMMDAEARRLGSVSSSELVARLRARTSTTNRPPAPVAVMLGEIVVHSEDIRRPTGAPGEPAPEALVGALDLFATMGFPVGAKKRIDGVRLVASDVGWSFGDGPIAEGSALSLLLTMTGRSRGIEGLSGEGVATLRERTTPAS
jgi:uncharacterized protein (TIGR03083 family)